MAILSAAILGCSREPESSRGQSRIIVDTVATRDTRGFSSPRAGDIWPEGSLQTVRWRSPWHARVNLACAMGGKDRGHLALGLDPGVDSLEWRIPNGFVTGFGIGSARNMRLRLENASDPALFVDSDTFTVTGGEP